MCENFKRPLAASGDALWVVSVEELEECFARAVRREKEREEAERRNFAAREQLRPLAYWLRTLNVGRTTLWRWEQQGKVTPTRIGGKVYYKETDFEFNERKEGRV